MATTTATILVGHAHQNGSGINPTHFIQFTENDRPARILRDIKGKDSIKVIFPTLENTIDDIYLMISVFILKKINPLKELHTENRKSFYEIFNKQERIELYEKSKIILQDTKIKVVFNVLDGSHLLNQLDLIKQYPNDYEVTVPFIKNEYSSWTGKVIFKEFNK